MNPNAFQLALLVLPFIAYAVVACYCEMVAGKMAKMGLSDEAQTEIQNSYELALFLLFFASLAGFGTLYAVIFKGDIVGITAGGIWSLPITFGIMRALDYRLAKKLREEKLERIRRLPAREQPSQP